MFKNTSTPEGILRFDAACQRLAQSSALFSVKNERQQFRDKEHTNYYHLGPKYTISVASVFACLLEL